MASIYAGGITVFQRSGNGSPAGAESGGVVRGGI